MASATVEVTSPSSSFFTFPPRSDPQTLPSPPMGGTQSAPPFSIPSSIYNGALDVKIPITIACIYAASVTALNAYNRSTGNKPWPISKTKIFFWFVVAHNILLAVYSGWTFIEMFATLERTVERWSGTNGLAATIDSLCKAHGASGLGNAIVYDPSSSAWVSQSPSTISLSDAGTPDATDLGRLWNEGLAFYGWLFYLSKFYEVLDTLIILAKGKKSSTLQTYHHAGAMMCMWAGIRFMSPPIWMFVFVNSGIHTLMYTYYTLTAFTVPIPQSLKRSLTTMQIMQFLVGTLYAAAHSFISYSIPVQVPDLRAASVVSTAVSSVATSTTWADVGSILKTILFRAAGKESLAKNLHGDYYTENAARHSTSETMQYHTEYQTIACIDTSGQTFAIWLNVIYLTPLTWLFVRFFIRSYLQRTGKGAPLTTIQGAAEEARKDAFEGVQRELYRSGKTNGATNGVANGKTVGKR
ncbi:hypothetical protein B7494_g8048 [Chlorociboria aeruginascens]|nr:hypothetical protein B7494_g8048 [Chlorociboria aeruginascens]